MTPGRYFKDKHYRSWIEVESVVGQNILGRSYIQGDLVDTSGPKIWFKQLHTWEPFDPVTYQRAGEAKNPYTDMNWPF